MSENRNSTATSFARQRSGVASDVGDAATSRASLPHFANPVAVPIYQTASFEIDDLQTAAELYGSRSVGEGFTYSRYTNPTVAEFEARMAALEGGVAAVAVASGMAAVTFAVLNIAQAGDNIVCAQQVYGSTRNVFTHAFRRFGIEARFADSTDPEAFVQLSDDRTRLWYGEALPNPSLKVFPIDAVARRGRDLGIPLVIDNTAAPLICRPVERGAAVVVHSATKNIGGHGAAIGGVIVDGGTFDWRAHAERFPLLTEPDPSYDGTVWTDRVRDIEALADAAYAVKLRRTLLRDFGPSLAPMHAFLFLQGLQTLPLRFAAQCETARAVARFLRDHPSVEAVTFPEFFTGDAAERVSANLEPGRFGALIGIELRGAAEAGARFIAALKLIRHVVNIGDVRTLATHPASTTHGQLTPEARRAAGVSDGYVRLSIGLEPADALCADLDTALRHAVATIE